MLALFSSINDLTSRILILSDASCTFYVQDAIVHLERSGSR